MSLKFRIVNIRKPFSKVSKLGITYIYYSYNKFDAMQTSDSLKLFASEKELPITNYNSYILKITIAILLICSPFITISQPNDWLWARYSSGKGQSFATATDDNGNVVTGGGVINGPMIFGTDTLPVFGLSDAFIAKYDQNGNYLWSRSAGGTGSDYIWDVITDLFGNIYAVGSFNSPFITIGSDTLYRTGGGEDTFIIKYDPLGIQLWTQNSLAIGPDHGFSIESDGLGNVYITGTFLGLTMAFDTITINSFNPGLGQVYLAKFNSSGEISWLRTLDGNSTTTCWEIATDKNGNSFVTGLTIADTILFGSDTVFNSNVNGTQIFVIKYNSIGDEIWVKSFGGNDLDRATSIAVDELGNIYITGDYESDSISFDSFTLYNSGNADIFIVKLSSVGNVIWAKSGNGRGKDFAWSVALDTTVSHLLFIYGGFGYQGLDTLVFDTLSLYPPSNSLDPFFIATFNYSGDPLCGSTLPTGGVTASEIAVDKYGNVLISGAAYIAPFIIGNDTMNGSSPYPFVGKWNCDTKLTTITNLEIYDQFQLFPNPANVNATLQFDNPEYLKHIFTLYNNKGQIVWSKSNVSSDRVTISVGSLIEGLYFFSLRTNEQLRFNGKLMVE